MTTTLTSTFVGALFAFFANMRIQKWLRVRADKAAGNVALAILGKQYGDFIIFRAGLRQELLDRKDLPQWLQLSPTIYRLPETLRFDVSSLSFLSERKKPDVIKWLMIAETRYHDLRMLIERNSEACHQRDINISKSTASPLGQVDFSTAVERASNDGEKAMLTHFNFFLQQRAKEDQQVYLDAAKALTEAMITFARPDEIMPFGPIGAKKEYENIEWQISGDNG